MFETRSEKRELEDKELKSELPDVTANEVPQEEKKVESLLIQPPETIKILDKTEGTAATNFIKVADVNVVNKGDVEAIEGEKNLESPSIADGKSKTNTEENQLNSEEELCGIHNEEGGMIIDKHLIVEADSVENAGVIIQTTDLAEGSIMDIGKLEKVCNIEEKMGNISSTETTSIEQDLGETSFEEEEKKSKISSSSVGHKTEEETESSEAAKDKLDESSSAAEGLDAGGNLENSSMVFEEGSQETIESNKVDELTEPEAEVSSREPVESMRRKSMDLVQTETLTMECKNEGRLGRKYMLEALKNSLGKQETSIQKISDDINIKEIPKQKNLSKVDLDDKNGSAEVEIPNKNGNNLCVTHPPVEVTVQVGGENHDEIPISESGDQVREAFEVHKEEEMQINEIYEAGKRPESIILEHTFNVRTSGPFNQKANEATKSGEAVEDNLHEISSTKVVPGAGENLENSSMAFEKGSQQTTESSENKKDVTSKDEIQTKNSESSLVQKVEDICFQKVEILETFKEETETETELKDIIKGSQIGEHNQNEILKTIATADSIQIITCKVDDNSEPIADVLSRDLEESTMKMTLWQKSWTKLKEQNMRNTWSKALCKKTEPTKENSESTLDVASEEIREQIPVGRPEEFLGETRNVETEISDDINKETLEEKNRKDQGHEAPKEEEQHFNETYEASKSPESTILEHTSTGVPVDIDDLEKGGELNIEEESRDINTADNIKEEIEQKEKASDEEFRITCDDNEKHTIEEEMPVMNSTPLCTGEEVDHYNQEDKSRPNNSEEATPESNGGDQSHKKSNESLNVKESITEEQVIQEYQNLKTPDRIGKELETISEGEDIGKQVLAEENRVEERSMVSAGELEAESSKEDAAIIKMPKQEVIEALQTADESTNDGMQTKEEDGTAKDNFAACAGEETKNECSYEEEKEEKEPDTEVLKTNYRAQDTTEHMVKNCVSIQSAESFEDKTIQESSQEDKVTKNYDNAKTSMIIEESAITDFPSPSVGDKIVEETLKEDRRETFRSEEEVLNANTECIVETFDAAHSAEERERLRYPSKRFCEEILEKADSKVTVVVDETSLTEAVLDYTMQADSSDLVSEEKGLVTEGGISNIPKPTECSNLGENKGMEIPTARTRETDEAAKTYTEGKNKASDTLVETEDLSEIARVETFLDASEQIIESSALSLEEHKVVMVEAIAEIAKDNILEMEDVTKNPTKMGSTDIEKESANVDAQDEDQEMYTPSKLINEKHMNESDVELLNRVMTTKKHTIEEEMPVTNSTPLCTGEEVDHYNQEDKSRLNNSEEATPESNRGDQSRKTSNESLNVKEPITEKNRHSERALKKMKMEAKFKAEMGKELETTNEGEDIEKQVLAEESIVQECSIVFAGELETENSKEDAMIYKDAQTRGKLDYGTSFHYLIAGAGEETKNECSYEEEEKEPDTEVLETNYRGQETVEHVVKDCVSIQSAESFEEKTVQESSQEDEVSNSNIECTVQTFDATHFIWEKEARALKMPSNQEIGEEILEEAHSRVTVVAEETSLTEAESKYTMQAEERGLVTEGAETYTEGENKAHDTEELSEIARAETSLDASELNIHKSSALSLEEQKVVMVQSQRENRIKKDKSENEAGISEASKGAKACDRGIDTEKPIGEQEDSAISFEGSSKEGVEIEKPPVELEAESHNYGSDASEATSISGLTKKNIKSVDIGEEFGSAPESMAEDESNIAFPETIQTNSEEEQYDVENQTADSTKDQISGQDIKKAKRTNEEMEPRLETQKETKETRDAIWTEKLPRDIQRADESELNEEQTMEGESCTKELHGMAAVDDMVNEVTDLDVAATQSLEATDSDNLTEIVKPKVAEDLNQELESSPMTKTLEEEIQRDFENPVDGSSSVSEVSEEKINKENTEDTEHCNTSQQDSEVDSMKLEEISTMVSQPPIHEDENAEYERITVENSDAHDAEVEEIKIPYAVSESKDQGVEEIHERGTSLTIGDIDTNEIEKQITEVPGALPVPIDQGAEAATDNEILTPTVVTEVTRSREFQLNDEPVEVLDTSSKAKSLETGKTADSRQQEAEVDNMKLEEASSMTSHLPTHEHQTADILGMNIEKSDAIDVEETKIPDTTSESKTQGATEIHETETIVTVGETDTNEIEEKTRDAAEALSEPVNQGDEAASKDDIARGGIVQAEKNRRATSGVILCHVSEPKDTDFEEVSSTVTVEEASSMTSHLPTHEHQTVDIRSMNIENSEATDVEVEETKMPDAASKSKVQGSTKIYETITSLTVGDTDMSQIEGQIREASETVNQGVEVSRNDEIAPECKSAIELTVENSDGAEVKAEENKTWDAVSEPKDQDFEEFPSSMKFEEASSTVLHLPIHEHQKADILSLNAEKSDAIDVEVEETKTSDTASESKTQGATEIHKTETSVTNGETNTNEIKEKTRDAANALSEPVNQGDEAANKDDIAPGGIVQAEKIEGPLQVSSSDLLPNEEDGETTTTIGKTEDACTKEDELDVDNLKLEKISDMDSHLLIAECESANKVTAEKMDTDAVKFEENKSLDAVSEPRDVEVVSDGQTPDQPLPVGKSEEELPVLSSPLFSSEQDFENNMSAIVEKSDANEVEVDKAKDSEDISESKVHGIAEIQEIGPRPTEGKTRTDEQSFMGIPPPNRLSRSIEKKQLQEPSSALLNEQDYKTITEVEARADESTKKAEAQLHETVADFFETGATEKPCLQNKGPRELEVSDFDSTVQEDPQNQAPEEESTAVEEASTVKPQEYIPERNNADFATEYDKTPVHCSSHDTSKDENIMDSGNSNKDSDDIPTYPEIKELLPGRVGEMCEEASNLEFEKTGKKTTEADEAIKKDTSEEKKKINQVELDIGHWGKPSCERNSLPVSPYEETVANSNQEHESLEEYCPGERTNEELFEESEKAGADKNIKKTITAEDRSVEDPYQVLVGDETANISPPEEVNDGKKVEKAPVKVDPESRGDEINFRDTAIEATTPIEEVKSYEVPLAKHEDRTGDSSDETVMSKDEKQKNTDPAIPPIKDAVAEEPPNDKFGEKFDEASTPAPTGPTHETIKTYGNCSTDGWNLKERELYVDKPSISSSTTTSQEEIADKENENIADEKQDFTSDKQTTEAARMLEEEKNIPFSEAPTKVEELGELSTIGNESKLDEANIHSTTADNEDEKTENLNEIPNLLSDAKDTKVSHEGGTMDFADVNAITKDTKELEKTSLSISHEQIARDADPSYSTVTINATASTSVPLVQRVPN
ncbi:hypothetical protein Acr_05g0008610 [Actinidia rufa]|uniref:Uncharacterized protein n=1 Tax=Actinidia rufa TaxID=165716 RepID=A0A7J0ELP1_9ERIC|nr:hypothetical protein Acr_05g0008610 [Actinidia rufa]